MTHGNAPPPKESDRRYPLPKAEGDDRFTIGLILEVAELLATHGYPRVTEGVDLVRLQQALFGFLYVEDA